jgi:hypothetical protein
MGKGKFGGIWEGANWATLGYHNALCWETWVNPRPITTDGARHLVSATVGPTL